MSDGWGQYSGQVIRSIKSENRGDYESRHEKEEEKKNSINQIKGTESVVHFLKNRSVKR